MGAGGACPLSDPDVPFTTEAVTSLRAELVLAVCCRVCLVNDEERGGAVSGWMGPWMGRFKLLGELAAGVVSTWSLKGGLSMGPWFDMFKLELEIRGGLSLKMASGRRAGVGASSKPGPRAGVGERSKSISGPVELPHESSPMVVFLSRRMASSGVTVVDVASGSGGLPAAGVNLSGSTFVRMETVRF